MADEMLTLREENRFLKVWMEEAKKREEKLRVELDEALGKLRALADDLR